MWMAILWVQNALLFNRFLSVFGIPHSGIGTQAVYQFLCKFNFFKSTCLVSTSIKNIFNNYLTKLFDSDILMVKLLLQIPFYSISIWKQIWHCTHNMSWSEQKLNYLDIDVQSRRKRNIEIESYFKEMNDKISTATNKLAMLVSE